MYLVLELFDLMKRDVNMGLWERKDLATGSFVRMSICCSSGVLRKDLERLKSEGGGGFIRGRSYSSDQGWGGLR